MAQNTIRTPLLNNNEDSVRIVEWHREVDDFVSAGELLVTVETTKVAQEVHADQSGYLRWICLAPFSRVDDILAILTDLADEPVSHSPITSADAQEEERRVTIKARALATRLHVDIDAIAGQLVTEKMVREAALLAGDADGVVVKALNLDEMLDGVPSGMATVIVGDGDHATYVHDTCIRAGVCHVVGCTSNDLPIGAEVGSMQVIGNDDDLEGLLQRGIEQALVGIGSSRHGTRSNEGRQRLYDRLKSLGFSLPAVVDPDASFAQSASIAEGTLVGAGAVVSTNARIGANCLINVGCVICHEVTLGDHVHVTPGAILAGTVTVGHGSTIGMAATVLDGTTIGSNCLVPNGYRVIADLADGQVAPRV